MLIPNLVLGGFFCFTSDLLTTLTLLYNVTLYARAFDTYGAPNKSKTTGRICHGDHVMLKLRYVEHVNYL